jgi:cobalamin biosynthesis Mg chelatase CobN
MMNEDMPWVDLTPEEVQELRSKKQELTQYGRDKIRKLMSDGKLRFYDKGKETLTIEDPYWGKCQTPKTQLHIKEMKHEEMLEEAAKREAANEVIIAKVSEEDYQKVQEEVTRQKEEKVLKIAIDFIEEHSEALKELRKIEHEELIEELQAKKKENFQLVADACMKEYEQKYQRDVFPVDEYWVYMISEYFGTGEGQTVCIMMTQATPYGDDFTEDNRYVPVNSKQYRAVREFHKQFGTWYLHGLKFLSKEDFFTECAYYIPPVMMKLSNKSCFKDFYTRVHYNFS